MSFPLAKRFAYAGHPIRRSDAGSTWFRRFRGLWWKVTDQGASIVKAGDYSAADLHATNWTILGSACHDDPECSCNVTPLADPGRYPATGTAEAAATFDVDAPPCEGVPV